MVKWKWSQGQRRNIAVPTPTPYNALRWARSMGPTGPIMMEPAPRYIVRADFVKCGDAQVPKMKFIVCYIYATTEAIQMFDEIEPALAMAKMMSARMAARE